MNQTREKVLAFGTFRLVPSRQQLFDGDRPMRIGSRALGLLEILLENAGEVVTKDKLIEAVWRGIWVDEANLRANIGALRKVLGDGRDGRRYIQNVPGRGYRFVEPVYRGEKSFAPTSPDKGMTPQIAARYSARLIGRSEAHGRFSGHGRPRSWIAADVVRVEDGKLAEHWDVLQDEATRAESLSGLSMFGDRFPA